MVIRKIRKVGNSFYITISKTYLKAMGLKLGDYVITTIGKKGIKISKLKVRK